MHRLGNQDNLLRKAVCHWNVVCVLAAFLLSTANLGCTHNIGWIESDDCEEDGLSRLGCLSSGVPGLRDLARQVTELEEDIHRCGSITVKQPDVWGDADLISYTQEYEQVMISQLGNFQPTIQGFVARSDQAELQSVTSLGAALAPSGAGGGQAANQNSVTVPIPFQGKDTSSQAPSVTPDVIKTTTNPQVFDVLQQSLAATGATVKPNFTYGLEPTESLRQNSTYLRVNQGLRRIGTGDVGAQSAGYGLYLLRVPVSILPGRKTQEGYSGVVSMRAQMVVDPNHLRVTFPKLALADLVDTLLPLYLQNWERGKDNQPELERSAPKTYHMARSPINPTPNPMTLDQATTLYGKEGMQRLLLKAYTALNDRFHGKPPYDELRNFLFTYLLGTYKGLETMGYLTGPSYSNLPPIGIAYLRGDAKCLETLRQNWENEIKKDPSLSNCGEPEQCQRDEYQKFGWMVVAQSAVLDRQLKDVLKDVLRAGHLPIAGGESAIEVAQFANSSPPPETLELWCDYIHAQYPLHVFELDPKNDEQNVSDAFSRRRELQLAIAFALANGNIRFDQALKFTRQLALDIETIDLNRTQVPFAHGDDTFGWYFYPRLQTPPEERSNIAAILRMIWATGPTREYDLRHRHLEPGMRECEVLVVMPNFVPELKLDVTTNWEKLTKPGVSKLGYENMVDQGKRLEEVRAYAASICGQDCYRPGDYERLVSRIDQLEKMLPLQTYHVNVPYQYDLPGGELFDKGATTLHPEITSCYGLRFISRDSTSVSAEFFIAGHHFHPTLTHVIIGGTEVHTIPSSVNISTVTSATPTATQLNSAPVEVISRDLIKVKVGTVSSLWSGGAVPIRVATPGGLSNEYELDPGPQQTAAVAYGFALKNSALTMNYTLDANTIPTSLTPAAPNDKLGLDWSNPTGVTWKTVSLNLSFAEVTDPIKVTYDFSNANAPTDTAAAVAKQLLAKWLTGNKYTGPKLPATITSTKLEVVPDSDDKHVIKPTTLPSQLKITLQAKPMSKE
jgi:hypothetical protein